MCSFPWDCTAPPTLVLWESHEEFVHMSDVQGSVALCLVNGWKMRSISVFIFRSVSGGACSAWNTKLKSSPLQKVHLWGRWQLLLTKYPKVSFWSEEYPYIPYMLSSILFGNQEKLTSNQRSSLQRRKIRNSQIQAEAAPLLLWCGCTSAFSQLSDIKSLPVEIGFISVKVEFPNMLRGGSAAVERAPEYVLAVRHCLERQESLVEFSIILDSSLFCLISGREVIAEKLPLMADLSKSTR